jgi:hypothetical protein
VAARTLTVHLQLEPIFMAVEKIMAARFYVVAARTLTVYLQLEPIFKTEEKILAARF